MAYMGRLGLWGSGTAFATFADFAKAAGRSGHRGMQLMVALELKARGCLVSRTLSYAGAEFEMLRVSLSAAALRQYCGACELWAQLLVRLLRMLWLRVDVANDANQAGCALASLLSAS